MEIISMDERVFNDLARRLETIEQRAERMHRAGADLRLQKWLDNQEVCALLGITKRTLQTYRENGMLPHCRIRHKIFYKTDDVQRLLDSHHKQA